MFKLRNLTSTLMITIFTAILFGFPNYSNAESSAPSGTLTTHSRSYTYQDVDGNTKTGKQSYLICSQSKGPKCESTTDWEFHINLTNFKVYVYHKEAGKWNLYATKDCAAGRIHDYSGLSVTASCVTKISRLEYRSSTDFSSFYYCLWTPTNYAMHSVLYGKDMQEPKGDYTFGKGRYVSGACVRMSTSFVKDLYTNQGNKLIGSRVIAYYTKDCFLFNPNNLKAQWTTINDNRYYFKKDGYLASGPTKIGDIVYYFDLDGTYTTSTGLKLRNHKYYFVKKGIVQTGWQTYNDKKYYFWKKSGTNLGKEHVAYQMAKGWISLNGVKYYLNKDGVLQYGWKTIDDKDYYFNKNGELQKGWITVDNKKYYSNPDTGVLQYGWQTINKKIYYFWKKSGTNLGKKHEAYQMATGLISLNGDKYYLNNEGVRQTGWKTINNKKYYFGSDGKAYVDVTKKIGDKKYTFDENGVVI